MPEVTTQEKGGHIRHTVTLQPGEKVMLCRCYGSKTFPFCDVSHRNLEGEVGPVIVEINEKPEDQPPAA